MPGGRPGGASPNPTCRSPTSTTRRARSGSCSTTARISSASGPASIQRLRWHLPRRGGPAQLRGLRAQSARARSLIGLPAARRSRSRSAASCSGGSRDQPTRARASGRDLAPDARRLPRSCSSCPAAGSSPRRSWSARSPAPSASHPTRSLPAIRAARRCRLLGPAGAIGSRAAATASSTAPFTGSRSPRPASTPRRGLPGPKAGRGAFHREALRCPSAISCVAPGSFFARVQERVDSPSLMINSRKLRSARSRA